MGTVSKCENLRRGETRVITKESFIELKNFWKVTFNDGKSEVEKINEQAGIKRLEVSDLMFIALLKACIRIMAVRSEGSFDMKLSDID